MRKTPAPGYHIDDDDRPVGHMLSRREALLLFGGVGAGVAVVAMAPGVLAQSASPLAAASPAARRPVLHHPTGADRGALLRRRRSWSGRTSGSTAPMAASRPVPAST